MLQILLRLSRQGQSRVRSLETVCMQGEFVSVSVSASLTLLSSAHGNRYYDLNMGSSLEVSAFCCWSDLSLIILKLDLLSRGDVADILVSAAYCAAGEGVLDPSPVGLGLRVPLPDREIQAQVARAYVPMVPALAAQAYLPAVPGGPMAMQAQAASAASSAMLHVANDGLCDFDLLNAPKVSSFFVE
jgi:hypothetical protein